jgi:hypothetical protein
MSFTFAGIPGEFVGENDWYLKNTSSGKYLYYDGTGCCMRDWSDSDMARFQWMITGDKVMTLDSSFIATGSVSALPSSVCGCPCACGPNCTGCLCECGCPRGVAPEAEPEPEVAPEAEPEPEVAPEAEPEAESDEDVPVARSSALIEEALKAKAAETGAPTPDAPVEQEDEEVPELESP